MNYFPFERITYTSKLDPEEVIQKMAEQVEPAQFMEFGTPDITKPCPYKGEVTAQGFDIKRIPNNRGGELFAPRASGIVEKGIRGTIIEVELSYNRSPRQIRIFLSIAFLACLYPMLSTWIQHQPISGEDYTPLVLLFILYLFYMLNFSTESKKVKQDLAVMLESEVVPNETGV
ncbi:MAG TPA: hypothetical protein VNZ86_10490 [Bacteroidia bacterium]|jgi:hypothetical protein|nr:hypothetical protein [Bacteroidia bacterium]